MPIAFAISKATGFLEFAISRFTPFDVTNTTAGLG
jgi:hypothetical protein